MLDGLKLGTATLGNVDIENRRPEIGVDCILVTRGPKPETSLCFSDDSVRMLAFRIF